MATRSKNNTTNRTLSSTGCWEGAIVPVAGDIARWYSASNTAGNHTGNITCDQILVEGASAAGINFTSGVITLSGVGDCFVNTNDNTRNFVVNGGTLAIGSGNRDVRLYTTSGYYTIQLYSANALTSNSTGVLNVINHLSTGSPYNAYIVVGNLCNGFVGTLRLTSGTGLYTEATSSATSAFNAASIVCDGENWLIAAAGASNVVGNASKNLNINFDGIVGHAARSTTIQNAVVLSGSGVRTLRAYGNVTMSGAVTGTSGIIANVADTSLDANLWISGVTSGLTGPCIVIGNRFVIGQALTANRYAPSSLDIGAGAAFEYNQATEDFNFPVAPTGSGTVSISGAFNGSGVTFPNGMLSGFNGSIRAWTGSSGNNLVKFMIHEVPSGGLKWRASAASGGISCTAQITYSNASNIVTAAPLEIDSGQNGSLAILTAGTYSLIVPSSSGTFSASGAVTRTNSVDTPSARMNLSLGGSNTGDNTLSGDISEAGTNSAILGITKVDAGRWVLSGANSSHTGVHTISAGTLSAQSEKALGSATSAGGVSVTGTGKLELAGNITLNKSSTAFSIHTNNPITSVGDNTLRTAGVTLNGTTTFQVTDANRLTIDNSSAISGNTFGIIKTGAGELVLNPVSNAYTGAVLVDEGTLTVGSVANSGSPAAWGQGTSVSVTGILNYNGTGHSSNRSVTLAGTSPTIKASGAGPLTLSNITQTSVAKTINLSGASTASNTISSAVTDTSFATSVAKSENGRWELSGALSYTGTTTVSAGVLRVTSTNSNTTSGTVTVDSGAEMELITSTSPAGSGNGRVLGSSNVVVNGKIKTGYSTTQRGQIRFGGNVTFGAGSELNIGAVAA